MENSDIGQLLYTTHLKTIQQLPELAKPVGKEEMEQLPLEILGIFMEGEVISEPSLGDH